MLFTPIIALSLATLSATSSALPLRRQIDGSLNIGLGLESGNGPAVNTAGLPFGSSSPEAPCSCEDGTSSPVTETSVPSSSAPSPVAASNDVAPSPVPSPSAPSPVPSTMAPKGLNSEVAVPPTGLDVGLGLGVGLGSPSGLNAGLGLGVGLGDSSSTPTGVDPTSLVASDPTPNDLSAGLGLGVGGGLGAPSSVGSGSPQPGATAPIALNGLPMVWDEDCSCHAQA